MGSQKLSEMLQQPYDLYKAGWADDYVLGLINQVLLIQDPLKYVNEAVRRLRCGIHVPSVVVQVSQAFDDSVSQEVTNHLFQGD